MRKISVVWRFVRASAASLPLVMVLACSGSSPTAPSNPGAGGAPPAPTPTPTPSPGRTIDIQRSHGGFKSVAGRNLPFADAVADFDVRGRTAGGYPGRAYAEALVSIGIGERPRATSSVYYDWSHEPGAYRVSADVTWRGYLAGNGFVGSGAKMTYELEVRDYRGRLLASELLHEREVRESALTLGGIDDRGSASASVDFTLPANTGGPFRILFVLTCEAYSGAIGADSGCLYGNNPGLGRVGLDGYAEWTQLSVTTYP